MLAHFSKTMFLTTTSTRTRVSPLFGR